MGLREATEGLFEIIREQQELIEFLIAELGTTAGQDQEALAEMVESSRRIRIKTENVHLASLRALDLLEAAGYEGQL